MPCIKVGLNEWIVVKKTNQEAISLWTDGLSGCVGVAITTSERAFMTHIDSRSVWEKKPDDKDDKSETIKSQFLEAIRNVGGSNNIEICEIVIGDDMETKLAKAVQGTLNSVLKDNENFDGASITLQSPGVCTYFEEGKNFQFLTFKRPGHQALKEALQKRNYKADLETNLNSISKQAEKVIEHKGFFSHPKGAPADI